MQKLLNTRQFLLAPLAILILCSLSGLALGCPDYQEADCDTGWAWFGLRGDDSNISQGQIVTLDCDASVVRAEFKFQIPTNPNQGVPPMVVGDEIQATLMDMDSNIINTTTSLIPEGSVAVQTVSWEGIKGMYR